MSLKSNLLAIKQSFNLRYIAVSWLFLGLSILGWVIGNIIFSKVGESIYKLLLKISNEKGSLITTLSLGLFISSSIAYFFFASLFIKADNQFWLEKPEHIFMPLSKVFKTSGIMFVLLSGIAFFSWTLYMIISPRLIQLNYLTVLPIAMLIFLPLLTRLIYYPATVAISGFSTTGQLNNLFGATKRKTTQALTSFLLQVLLLLVIVGFAYALTNSFIYDLYIKSAFNSSSFPEFTNHFAAVMQEIDYIKLAILFIISAPVFAIFANLQVSIIRNLLGVYNQGNYEKHYNVYSKQKENVKFDMAEDIEDSSPKVSGDNNDNSDEDPSGSVSVNLDPFQDVQIDETIETAKEDVFSHFDLDNPEQNTSPLNQPDNSLTENATPAPARQQDQSSTQGLSDNIPAATSPTVEQQGQGGPHQTVQPSVDSISGQPNASPEEMLPPINDIPDMPLDFPRKPD